ncbi:MAG: hypothetical protein ACSW75_02000, partial [Lachnospiraceae bacterium]
LEVRLPEKTDENSPTGKEPVILSEAKNLEDGLPEKTDENSPTGKEPVILSEAKNLEDGLPEKTDENSPTGKEPVILSEAKNFEGRFPQEVNPQPGTLTRLPDGTLAVQTGKGLLLPLEVQLEGKRRMTIQEFLRGYRMKEAVLGI